MRRVVLSLVTPLALAFVLSSCQGCRPEPQPTPEPLPTTIVELEVGLSVAERTVWRFTSEGSDLLPVDILRALIDVDTGKTFDRSLDRYGFLPSPAGPDNPYGLAIGWTTSVPPYSPWKLDYAGLNCSACHTGQVEIPQGDGSRVGLRIDGAPNMADIEAFAQAAEASVVDMLEDPIKTLLFVWRLLHLEPPAHAEGRSLVDGLPDDQTASLRAFLDPYAEAVQNEVAEPKDLGARILGEHLGRILRQDEESRLSAAVDKVASALQTVEDVHDEITNLFSIIAKYRALLENRLQLAKNALGAINDPATPAPGPGRDDPWGIIRNTVFLTPTALTAPTSIPHLYWAKDFVWYHADGNTNSVTQRNVAQALALGAYVDPPTDVSSLLAQAVFDLEDLMAKLRAPAWPADHFGPIDTDKAARGAELFQAHCQECHNAREGTLFPLDEIGTDATRATNFLRPQDGEPFWDAIPAKVVPLQDFAFQKAGITPEEAARHEVPNPTWRGTDQYQARQLDGIWSTAPYLHNGSVPTLYDLLLPVDQRPTSFQLGDRAYDPAKVGYVQSTTDPIFVYDATSTGGSNGGHEAGTGLTDEERWALVEFMKTL